MDSNPPFYFALLANNFNPVRKKEIFNPKKPSHYSENGVFS